MKILIYKFAFITSLIFICNSCCYNIVGEYTSPRRPSVFLFDKDSTYYYEYANYDGFLYSSGKWESIDRNTINLVSEIKDISIPLSVKMTDKIKFHPFNNISINLKINNGQKITDYTCEVYINNKAYCKRNCDSIDFIPITVPISTCYFKIRKEPEFVRTTIFPMPLVTNKYINNDSIFGKNLLFEIEFDDSYFFYRPFNNVKINVKRNKIKIFNPPLNKWTSFQKVLNESHNIFYFPKLSYDSN